MFVRHCGDRERLKSDKSVSPVPAGAKVFYLQGAQREDPVLVPAKRVFLQQRMCWRVSTPISNIRKDRECRMSKKDHPHPLCDGQGCNVCFCIRSLMGRGLSQDAAEERLAEFLRDSLAELVRRGKLQPVVDSPKPFNPFNMPQSVN